MLEKTVRKPNFSFHKDGLHIAMWHSDFGLIDPSSIRVKVTVNRYNKKTKKVQVTNLWSLEHFDAFEVGKALLEKYIASVVA